MHSRISFNSNSPSNLPEPFNNYKIRHFLINPLLSPLAVLLTIFASLLHIFRDFQTKNARDKNIFVWWFSALSLLFSFPFALSLVLQNGLEPLLALGALAMGTIHFLYWYSYAQAYEKGDLSYVYPIIRSAPALVLVLAIVFLREQVTALGVAGILTITAGVYSLNLKKFTLQGFFEPFRSMFHEQAARFAFFGLLLVGTYTILDRLFVKHIHPIVYGVLICFSACIFYGLTLLRTKGISAFKKSWREERQSIVLNAIFAAIVYPVILYTYSFANVSYVTALRQISVIFAVLLGSQVLKEKQKNLRLVCSIIIVAGAVMIAAS